LKNNKAWSQKSKLTNWSVHAWKKICKSLTESYKKSKKFLRWLEHFSILFTLHVNINNFGTNK
jgi:hypothetical protein